MSYPYLRILLFFAVIGVVVFLVVLLVKKLFKNVGSAPAVQTYEPTTTDSPSYSATSKIFINGGAPVSGNIMGKISIDGDSLTVRYTDAPVEITISAGSHHVVVEGGVDGDARIDRYIDFGVLDVWTVDLPGAGDADVIRHQMISSSEYRRALADSNFHVTKKQL